MHLYACTQVINVSEMFVEKAGVFAQNLFHFILSFTINLSLCVLKHYRKAIKWHQIIITKNSRSTFKDAI